MSDRGFKSMLILVAGTLLTFGLVYAGQVTDKAETAKTIAMIAFFVASGTVSYRWYIGSPGGEDRYTRGELAGLVAAGLLCAAALGYAALHTTLKDNMYGWGAFAVISSLLYALYDAKLINDKKDAGSDKKHSRDGAGGDKDGTASGGSDADR